MIEGRGMFYGETDPWGHKRVFSPAQWDAICRQAVDWGIQWLHPKVADGGFWWYDANPSNTTGTSLAMLAIGAHHHGLKLAPYHYCYGNKFNYLAGEAEMSATIANMCDACVPDMEIEWNNQPQWAIDFGKIARQHSPHGQFYPTLFGDPGYFPGQPYVEWSHWINGWMPMVYFSVWTNRDGTRDTAQDAVNFVYPQWAALNERIHAAGVNPTPILPLIEVGSALPPEQVANWLHLMGHYGYCGFWYDGLYAPYVTAVKSQPVPALPQPPSPSPQPQPHPQPQEQEQPFAPPPLKGPGLTEEPGDPVMNQNLTSSELAVMWHMGGLSKEAMNLTHPIPGTWAALMQKRPDFAASYLGGSVGSITQTSMAGVAYEYLDFAGGSRLVYFPASKAVAICASPLTGGHALPPQTPSALATLETLAAPVAPGGAQLPSGQTPLESVAGMIS